MKIEKILHYRWHLYTQPRQVFQVMLLDLVALASDSDDGGIHQLAANVHGKVLGKQAGVEGCRH